jgi:transmembrane sensor
MMDEKSPASGPAPATDADLEPTGTRLAAPIGQHLMTGLDEALRRRMWQNIEGRLSSEPRSRARLAGALAAAACALLVATTLGLWGPRLALWNDRDSTPAPARATADVPPTPPPLFPAQAHERAPEPLAQAPGPLVLADGRPFEHLEGEARAARSLRLSDGSTIEAEPGARVEALSSGATEFSLVVRRGRVRFSVTPGGPRRWSIEARGTRVDVVGTVLSVDSSEAGVRVAVEVGAVVVRSASIPDGVQRLGAGQSLQLPATSQAETPPALDAARPVTAPARSEPPEPRRTRRPAPPLPPARRAAEVRDLWERADAARRTGDAREATELLTRLVREHPSDARAPLGAFTLGSLLADELKRPAEAAVAFQSALDLGLPAMLRDACFLSLAAALRDARDAAGVRAVVRRYAAESPDGEPLRALRALEQQTLSDPGSAP